MRYFKFILLLPILISVVLGLAEVGLRLTLPEKNVVERSSDYYVSDKLLGFKPRPNVSTQVKKYVNGKKLYDVTYSFDEHGWRKTIPHNKANEFVIFLGDSVIFGEGVDDRETIPSQFARLSPNYTIYNFAFRGYGPQSSFVLAEHWEKYSQVNEKKGIIIYAYSFNHWHRLLGSPQTLKWGGALPYVTWNSFGGIEHIGSFVESVPVKTYIFSLLANFKLAYKFRNEFMRLITTKRDYLLACEVIRNVGEKLRVRYPDSRFLVVVHPYSHAPDPTLECLKKKTEVHEIMPGLEGNEFWTSYMIPQDWHLSPKGNELYAKALWKSIFFK